MSTGPWTVIFRDVDKTIEQRTIGKGPDGALYEERTTWTGASTVEARLSALEAKVDTVEATVEAAAEAATLTAQERA